MNLNTQAQIQAAKKIILRSHLDFHYGSSTREEYVIAVYSLLKLPLCAFTDMGTIADINACDEAAKFVINNTDNEYYDFVEFIKDIVEHLDAYHGIISNEVTA